MKLVQIVSNQQQGTDTVNTSAGATDAGKVPALNAAGQFDPTMLVQPSAAIAVGATSPAGVAPGHRLWSTTTGCELVWDGAAWRIPAEGVLRALLGSDVSSTSATASDVSGLSFAVKSGVAYTFDFLVNWQCAATTGSGIGLSINGPAFTRLAYTVDTPSSATARTQGNRRAYDTFGVVTTIDTATSDTLAIVRGVITPSADGTLVLRMRAGTAGSSATVKAGSCGLLRALATDPTSPGANSPIGYDTIGSGVTAYTLVLGDSGRLKETLSASAVSITVPPNSSVPFQVGTLLMFCQGAAGLLTLVAGSGVTLKSRTTSKSGGQEAVFALLKIGTDTWRAYGDLAAS